MNHCSYHLDEDGEALHVMAALLCQNHEGSKRMVNVCRGSAANVCNQRPNHFLPESKNIEHIPSLSSLSTLPPCLFAVDIEVREKVLVERTGKGGDREEGGTEQPLTQRKHAGKELAQSLRGGREGGGREEGGREDNITDGKLVGSSLLLLRVVVQGHRSRGG